MDLALLIDRVRQHYVDQFERFVDVQNEACRLGHAEVKFLIPEPTGLFQRLMHADFVKNDDGVEVVWFAPEHVLDFERFSGTFGGMRVVVDALRWDCVVLHHSGASLQLDDWFQRWFDPDDRRHDPGAKLGLVIHSLTIEPDLIEVDFGTAPSEALWQLLEELERAGVELLTIDGITAATH